MILPYHGRAILPSPSLRLGAHLPPRPVRQYGSDSDRSDPRVAAVTKNCSFLVESCFCTLLRNRSNFEDVDFVDCLLWITKLCTELCIGILKQNKSTLWKKYREMEFRPLENESSLGSGPRYQILSHVFAHCASQTTHGHARIARVSDTSGHCLV